MSKKSPLSQVQQRFESKEKLVAEVQKLATEELWLDRLNDNKGLARVSNAKLLRLHDILADAKSRFGSRAKLIDAILDITKRVRDAGYKARLEGHPLPRLLDLHGALAKQKSRAEAKEAKKNAPPAKKGPAKKTVAKKAVAKKAVAKKVPAKKGGKKKKAGKKK